MTPENTILWRFGQREYRTCKTCHMAYRAKHVADFHLRKAYGITLAQKLEMLRAQGGCAICGGNTTQRGKDGKPCWHVDHDHATKKVRGVLCGRCNMIVGIIENRPGVFEKAQRYILQSRPEAEAQIA